MLVLFLFVVFNTLAIKDSETYQVQSVAEEHGLNLLVIRT
jgi:hypothetical protein